MVSILGIGAHLASYPICITGLISLAVKPPGREAGHSPPFSTEIKNAEVVLPLLSTCSWHVA